MTREEFAEFVRVAGMGVVATVHAEGNPEAALVDLVATSAGEVIFDSAVAARKVGNIAPNPRVALVVGWSDGVSVQVEGLADTPVLRTSGVSRCAGGSPPFCIARARRPVG